ncbi:unnamed protein product [Blepharisma stoltei]|uniref:Uncharacterized protein n=1 Tax=Blepharisma stoltei TaxID=1481888 RepID=A0AAU9JFZ6_9CILI|nr:unnamed protein product [Blepharisma stoltei]
MDLWYAKISYFAAFNWLRFFLFLGLIQNLRESFLSSGLNRASEESLIFIFSFLWQKSCIFFMFQQQES